MRSDRKRNETITKENMTTKKILFFSLVLLALALVACGGAAGAGNGDDAVGVVYRSPT